MEIRALKSSKTTGNIKIVANNIEEYILKNIIVFNPEIVKSKPLENIDIFLFRIVREKYKSKVISKFIDYKKGSHILNICLKLGGKEILFRFRITNNNIPFKVKKSNANSINIEIGDLKSIDYYHLVENLFNKKVVDDIKGIKNENYIINIAKSFASINNYTFVSSKDLDNYGVDFCLVNNVTSNQFYFQVKSSWFHVDKAKKLGKGFYKDKKIIFLVKNKICKNFYGVIKSEIEKQSRFK